MNNFIVKLVYMWSFVNKIICQKELYSCELTAGGVKMNHIGKIIKEYRCMMNMTRKDLAKNICTENYIYLIEKGKRSPSSDMLILLGDRLGVDMSQYHKFLDCLNPIKVYEIIQKLATCQRNTDFYAVQKIVQAAMKLPDFKHKPWAYIIAI
jgi:transcriptional regulator with XRE-family HTH domain